MSAPIIPAGQTIVQTFRKSFVDVPVDADKENAIATLDFLEAAESLTTIFGTKPRSVYIGTHGMLTCES